MIVQHLQFREAQAITFYPKDDSFWSWLAGFWEGEGSFIMVKNNKYAFFTISQKKRQPLDYIKNQLDKGTIYFGKRTGVHKYSVSGRQAIIDIVTKLIPYLRFRSVEVKPKLEKLKDALNNSNHHYWTPKEIEYLKNSCLSQTDKSVGKALRLTKHAVEQKRRRLNIFKGRR